MAIGMMAYNDYIMPGRIADLILNGNPLSFVDDNIELGSWRVSGRKELVL